MAGGDGAAWPEGHAAKAFACDASITLWSRLTSTTLSWTTWSGCAWNLRRRPACCGHGPDHFRSDTGRWQDGTSPCRTESAHRGPDPTEPASDLADLAYAADPRGGEALERAIIGKAIDLVSGPGGLASFLRTGQLGSRLAGPSLPLDVGHSAGIPAAIRRAVTLRDQHCQWAGGCDQPAVACEVHHLPHLADGGTTCVRTCGLYCFFHHHIAINRWAGRWP